MLIIGRRLGFCQEHVLLCYSPLSYRSEVLIGKTSEKKHILNLLAEKIDAFCKKERILFSSFLFVSEFDELLTGNLQNFGYLKSPGLTNFYLDVRWSSFNDYLESFNCKLRKNIRREIRKCAENSVAIEELEFVDLPAYVSELTSNLNLKYTNKVTSYSSLLSKLSEHAKDKTKVFIAKKNNEVVGFSLNLRQGDILDTCFTGFKYDILTNTDFIYFNVCYYAPIRWAIEEGIKKIYYRDRGEKVKLHRGCKPENTYSFLKCHDELLGPLINNLLRTPLYSHLSQRELGHSGS
jgi:predicted N-acyltransferase